VRVLLDTNVLISAVLFGGIPQQCLRRGLAGEFELVTGVALLDELTETLRDRFGLASEAVSFARGDLELAAEMVLPSRIDPVSRDPGDDVVLAVAREGRVDYVVTGDRDLLDLGHYEGIAIVTPRYFLEVLDRPAER
jgi:putative PIN family toxin of toxin-antitoxin system